jgi:hypothetical protein
MAWLTKSRFLAGLQCHKRLWFEIHQPLEEPVEPSVAMLQGRSFDEVVQQLHPGVVVSRDAGMPAAIAATRKLLSSSAKPPAMIYQPAFRAGDLAVIADVLRRHDAQYELIEVKATTAVKDIHIPDAAFQTLVLQRAKIPVGRVFIGHVNNQFVLRRAGDYSGLVVEVDVTDLAQGYLQDAADKAVLYQEVMRAASAPAIAVGPHCRDPYECPFLARCTAGEDPAPEFPVDVLPRGGKTVEALLAEGYRDLLDVPVERLTNEMHQRVYEATRSGLAFFDLAATAALRQLRRPYAYLDFETISCSVPTVIGTRPYEQLPFQWSVHIEQAAGDIRHVEYLAIESFGDFDAMARALIAALPSEGPIFAYNASFEAGVLNRLAERLPAHAPALRGFVGRLVDLFPVTRAV